MDITRDQEWLPMDRMIIFCLSKGSLCNETPLLLQPSQILVGLDAGSSETSLTDGMVRSNARWILASPISGPCLATLIEGRLESPELLA